MYESVISIQNLQRSADKVSGKDTGLALENLIIRIGEIV